MFFKSMPTFSPATADWIIPCLNFSIPAIEVRRLLPSVRLITISSPTRIVPSLNSPTTTVPLSLIVNTSITRKYNCSLSFCSVSAEFFLKRSNIPMPVCPSLSAGAGNFRILFAEASALSSGFFRRSRRFFPAVVTSAVSVFSTLFIIALSAAI